jgi:allantoinase
LALAPYDLLITGADVALPGSPDAQRADIAVKDGVISRVAPSISRSEADDVLDASGLVAMPGVIDAHQHWGIYNELDADADSESRASAIGGVTTGLTYMRTGQYYLNKSGPYATFFPEVLRRTEGRAYVDYAFHLAPMMKQHIDEIPQLVDEFGVTSFKIFMFYGGHGLHGRSDDQSSFLMTPPDERYDYAHFEFVMRGIQAAREQRPDIADEISLSLHCETAEIMTAYTRTPAS